MYQIKDIDGVHCYGTFHYKENAEKAVKLNHMRAVKVVKCDAYRQADFTITHEKRIYQTN